MENPGHPLDFNWFNNVSINLGSVNEFSKKFIDYKELRGLYHIAWLLRAVSCIDLTTLAGDDTESNVIRLCLRAAFPINKKILKEINFENITTASVCVYPLRVKDAVRAVEIFLPTNQINVAAVAAGFPSGQFPLRTRLDEIRFAIEQGANEIDIVIDRSLVLRGKWETLYCEIKQMKKICATHKVHLKTILSTGELGSLSNIYKASMIAMMAGSDFIKTSTGKETINATLSFGVVMCRAIRDYYRRTGYKVGFKPAGGIKTSKDALSWLFLINEILGKEWLNKDLFRFGASGLLDNIEKDLFRIVFNREPSDTDL